MGVLMARTGQPQMAADQAAAEGSDLRWSQFKELATLVLGSERQRGTGPLGKQ